MFTTTNELVIQEISTPVKWDKLEFVTAVEFDLESLKTYQYNLFMH